MICFSSHSRTRLVFLSTYFAFFFAISSILVFHFALETNVRIDQSLQAHCQICFLFLLILTFRFSFAFFFYSQNLSNIMFFAPLHDYIYIFMLKTLIINHDE
jgi:hypothetical protein